MKDYSEMSYFDINKAVGIALGIDLSGITQNNYQMYNMKDYCNSWADAGPIIQKHGITVACYKNHKSDAWCSAKGIVNGFIVEHDNPLRAAMIVFLMMQERK